MQLGGVSSPQLSQARHSHMLRGLSPSMTLDPVALTGATVVLRRGLAEVFCSRSPAKTGTPFHVNVQQTAGQEEHSSYAQHVWQALLKGVAGIQEICPGHKKPEGLGGERYPLARPVGLLVQKWGDKHVLFMTCVLSLIRVKEPLSSEPRFVPGRI